MFCHKCGTQIADGAGFCHKCGTQVVYEDAEGNSPAAGNTATNASGNKLRKIIIPALVIIILIALITSGALQNALNKLEDINLEIENQATGSTTVRGMQIAVTSGRRCGGKRPQSGGSGH